MTSHPIPLSACRPHDLLGLASPEDLVGEPAPDWVAAALHRAPFVVVRRAPPQGPLLPVGVRGEGRSQRFAAFLAHFAADHLVQPEDLAASHAWRDTPRADLLPHFAALDAVAALISQMGLTWGPVGGMGFELASGAPVLTAESDIDLLIHAPVEPGRQAAADLLGALGRLGPRIDAQLAVPAGAIALAEYVEGPSRLVLRGQTGPRLVVDPWKES